MFVFILAIVSISLIDGNEFFEEFESNGSIFDDVILKENPLLEETNVLNDPLNIEKDNISGVSCYYEDSISEDSTFTENPDIFDYKIDLTKQSTNTLYQGFEEELARIQANNSEKTTKSSSISELEKDIERNTKNLENVDKLYDKKDSALKESVKQMLTEENKYLSEQKDKLKDSITEDDFKE